jgi:multidrug efflux pump subunit AcrA (membrane-fusion protein)
MQADVDPDALVRDAIETTIRRHSSRRTDAREAGSRGHRSNGRAARARRRPGSACGTAKGESADKAEAAKALTISVAAATEQPIARFLKVTGTLAAEEEAEVAAEIQGRVIATPVERGTHVAEGSDLIRISPAEAQAQAAEAEANAAQLEGRLGLNGGAEFEIDRVPEVANARAQSTLAQGDFDRAKMLFDKKLLSQADFDQRSAQAEVARRQFEIARNGAMQQYQALLAARARVVLAKKALADTRQGPVCRRGRRAARLRRRLRHARHQGRLGAAHQSVARAADCSRAVQHRSCRGAFGVVRGDASPGQKFTGQVRYVSPALEANSRTLVVEAVVPNDAGALKPGAFATALIEQANQSPGVLTPAAAVRTVAGTSRVFVVVGDKAEERIVTIGLPVGDLIEITSGLKAGENVATSGVAQLADGVRVAAR